MLLTGEGTVGGAMGAWWKGIVVRTRPARYVLTRIQNCLLYPNHTCAPGASYHTPRRILLSGVGMVEVVGIDSRHRLLRPDFADRNVISFAEGQG